MNRTPYYLAVFVFLLISIGATAYFYQHPIPAPSFSFAAPCSTPIPYTVGTIDPRFGTTKEAIVARLAEAADLWNTAAGKPVFAYAPDNLHAIPVNFVYDRRQETVTLGKSIDSTEASQTAERAEIEAAQQVYLAAQQAYAAKIASFNTDSQAYAREVRRVNAAGGADRETYDRLQAEQAALKVRQTELNAQGTALNQQGDALQARIDAFNASVHSINAIVDTFNATASGDFEEGQYVRGADGKERIDIYAYKDQAELLHSLAHEFGHALGLEHNQNAASIMFPYNKEGVDLSADDIAALKAACKLD